MFLSWMALFHSASDTPSSSSPATTRLSRGFKEPVVKVAV
jgi:hypothetical protein